MRLSANSARCPTAVGQPSGGASCAVCRSCRAARARALSSWWSGPRAAPEARAISGPLGLFRDAWPGRPEHRGLPARTSVLPAAFRDCRRRSRGCRAQFRDGRGAPGSSAAISGRARCPRDSSAPISGRGPVAAGGGLGERCATSSSVARAWPAVLRGPPTGEPGAGHGRGQGSELPARKGVRGAGERQGRRRRPHRIAAPATAPALAPLGRARGRSIGRQCGRQPGHARCAPRTGHYEVPHPGGHRPRADRATARHERGCHLARLMRVASVSTSGCSLLQC